MIRAASGFTRSERTRINDILKTGATYAQAAREVGMSSSSFYKTKKAGAKPLGRVLRKRFVESSDYTLKGPSGRSKADTIGWDDDTDASGNFQSAGLERILRVNDPSNPFRPYESADETYAIAETLLDEMSIDEREELFAGERRVERPTVTKTIRGPDGEDITLSWKFGRGKSQEQRDYIQEQLDYYGIDEYLWDEYYDEATGYTSGEQ